jgi:type III secretory pathway component EscR
MGSLRSKLKSFLDKQSIKEPILNIHEIHQTFLQDVININPNNSFHIQRIPPNHSLNSIKSILSLFLQLSININNKLKTRFMIFFSLLSVERNLSNEERLH